MAVPAGFRQLKQGWFLKDDGSGPYFWDGVGAPTLLSGGGSLTAIYNYAKVLTGIAAIKLSGSNRVNIPYLGHSEIQGVCSDNTTNQTYAASQTWRNNCWAAKLADAFATRYGGTAGRGIETLAINQVGRWTLGGGAVISSAYNGAGVNGIQVILSGPTLSVSFTALSTLNRVYGYATATGTIARYQVNGGAVQTAPAAGSDSTGFGARVWYEFDVPCAVGNTITLLGPSSGIWVFLSCDLNHLTSPGVSIHRQAWSGYMLAQITGCCLDASDTQPAGGWTSGADEASFRYMQGQSVQTRFQPGSVPPIVFCTTDINDLKAYGNAATPWTWTLARQKLHKKNHAQYLAGFGIQLLEIAGIVRDPALTIAEGCPYSQRDFINMLLEVSDEEPNMAVLDLTQLFSGADLAAQYATQGASGWTQDGLHANSLGCVEIAGYIDEQIALVP